MEDSALFAMKKVYLCSKSRVVSYSFVWTLENFIELSEQGGNGSICSPLLKTECEKYAWKLELWYNGNTKRSCGCISLFLHNVCERDYKLKVSLSIMNFIPELKLDFKHSRSHHNFGFPRLVSRKELFNNPGFLSTGNLKILCEIKVLEDLCDLTFPECESKKPAGLSAELGCLLKDKKFCDATIMVGDCEFKVHRYMLAARSSVFAAMFSHDFKEAQTNAVKIDDVSPSVMEQVIQYIYTDEFPGLQGLVEVVLPIADKYALLDLKDMCSEELYSRLTVDSAAQTLVLADLYNVTPLKEKVVKFIVMNAKAVLATPPWIEMEKENHPLIAEVASAFMGKLHIDKEQKCEDK